MAKNQICPNAFARFRKKMEDAFGIDFKSVVVCRGAKRDCSIGRAPETAVTIGQSIHLFEAFFALDDKAREVVLAHELAHTAQKRLGAGKAPIDVLSPAYRHALEREADAAAANAMAGRPARCILPDAPSIPASWGPAGHYFTTYFVMLASSGNPEQSRKRAFFCQMPDQVYEFDATSAAIDFAWGTFSGAPRPISGYYPATPPEDVGWVTEDRLLVSDFSEKIVKVDVESPACRARRMKIDWQISTGLHSLTAREGKKESLIREAALFKYKSDDLRFGVALHAYGDSYAHRDLCGSGAMYGPIIGHGKEMLNVLLAMETFGSYFKTAEGAHEPDDIASQQPGRATLYMDYVANLHRICSKTMDIKFQPLSAATTVKLLGLLTNIYYHDTDTISNWVQSGKICEFARKTGIGKILPGYNPNEENPSYWKTFAGNHSNMLGQYGGKEKVFAAVRALGAEWAAYR